MGCVGPGPGTPPSDSDSRFAGALVTGIFDPKPRAAPRRRVNHRPATGPQKVHRRHARRAMSRGCACDLDRNSWPRCAGTGGVPEHSPPGHARRPRPVEPPPPGCTSLQSAFSDRSPRTVAHAVLASIGSCQARPLPTGGPQLLPISQTFPGTWDIKLSPPAVVRMVTLVRATRKVGDTARRDQQSASLRGSVPASLHQTVLAEFTIHLAKVAVSHAVNDDAKWQN